MSDQATYDDLLSRTRAIVDNIVDGVVTIDDQGLIETVNPSVERIFGYAQDELIGRNIAMLMPNPYRSQHDQYLANYLETGKKKVIGIGREVRGLRKDGSEFPLDLAVSEMRINGKRMFTGIVRDISERKETEAKLQQAMREVHEQKVKEEFIATVSHELRTPLTSIKAALELIEHTNDSVPQETHLLLDIARKNSERVLLLINDILDAAKLEASEMDVSINRIPLRQFLETAINDNQTYASKYNVTFALKECPSTTYVDVDPNRMMQVMGNILSNAAKFSPAGSTVEILAREDDRQIRISIRDQGDGIPEEFHNRIFKKFSQAKTNTPQGGTGLGLYIAKSIVDKHNGTLSFETQNGEGTEFHIDLPKREQQGEQAT